MVDEETYDEWLSNAMEETAAEVGLKYADRSEYIVNGLEWLKSRGEVQLNTSFCVEDEKIYWEIEAHYGWPGDLKPNCTSSAAVDLAEVVSLAIAAIAAIEAHATLPKRR